MANQQKSSEVPRPGTPVLVSACLLGQACRYDGKSKLDSGLEKELEDHGLRAVPFCPEEMGGLPTPRPKSWIAAGDSASVWTDEAEVVTEEGLDVTREFKSGARLALEECVKHGITRAYLKERSPSCGVKNTHVDGRLVAGPGVTAALLLKNGIRLRGC